MSKRKFKTEIGMKVIREHSVCFKTRVPDVGELKAFVFIFEDPDH